MVDPRYVACHEIGHSVGLRHGIPGVDNNDYDDCMYSGLPPASVTTDRYHPHHLQHINARA